MKSRFVQFIHAGLLIFSISADGNAYSMRLTPIYFGRAHESLTAKAIDVYANNTSTLGGYLEIVGFRDIIECYSGQLDPEDLSFYIREFGPCDGLKTHYYRQLPGCWPNPSAPTPPSAYYEAVNPYPGRGWWSNAIRFYRTDRAKAYGDLGRTLHLLQDMGSPPHVYLIEHDFTDPWEEFASYEKIDPIQPTNVTPLHLESLRAYFDAMAKDAGPNSDLGPVFQNTLNSVFSQGNYAKTPDETELNLLAGALLPRVVQYSAGLIRFYDDIVHKVNKRGKAG